MKIQDTVYVVGQSTLFDIPIRNSASIYRAEVVAIKAKIVTVKIEIDSSPVSYIIQQVEGDTISTSPQQAFEQANRAILTKEFPVYESDNVQ